MHRPLGHTPSPGAQLPSPEVQRYLDLSGELVLQLDPNERVTLVNQRLVEVLGFEEAELLGHNWFDTCVPARDREAARSAFHRIVEGRRSISSTVEGQILTHEGARRAVAWRSSLLTEQDGTVVGILSLGEDVTDRVNAESELARTLRELEAYRFALDSSAIVAMTDKKGRITHVNDRLCEISGFSRPELLGQDHRLLNSGYHSQEFFKHLWQTIRSGEVWRGDIRNRAKDGSMYWVATTIVPFLDDDGKPWRYVAIRSEITDRKVAEGALERTVRQLSLAREEEGQRAQALAEANEDLKRAQAQIRHEQSKLIQAEKLSSIGLLAAGVAHEINNPLLGVMACVKGLQEGTVEAKRRDEYFATARDGLVRIEQTVRGLLEFAAQRQPAPSDLVAKDLVQACLRLIAPMARKKYLEVEVDIPDDLSIQADRSQLMQAVMNVLLNAMYVSPLRTTVRVEAQRRPGQVGLRISDEGPGMPAEVIRRACDPFFSTKPEGEGTGLGLAVTLSIVQAHSGDLEFEPGLKAGTAVTLWLPTEGTHESVRP